jgi:SAM-dependent methyltransferase
MAWLLSGPLADRALAPLWNRRNATLNDAALQALALSADDRVLEVGFGGGYLLERMAATVTRGLVAGADASPGMAARCRRRFKAGLDAGRLDVRCATAQDLPFGDEAFGKAVSVNSLFYWPDAAAGVRELARVLAPGGRVVLCLTCRECMESRLIGRVVQLWDAPGLRLLAMTAGFRVSSMERLADRHRQYWRLILVKPPLPEAAAPGWDTETERLTLCPGDRSGAEGTAD